MAILLSAVVCIYLEMFLSDIIGTTSLPPDGSYQTVTGRVHSKEVRRDYQNNILPVIYIVPIEQKSKHSELVQCYLESGNENLPSIGEYAEVSGKVKVFLAPTNPGEFDSRLYYSTLKISYRLTSGKVLRTGGSPNKYRETLYMIRRYFENALDKVLPERDSAIMKAMLLGDKAYMDEETKDMYKSNGLMHILAVSGLHISLIGMGFYELLKKLRLSKIITAVLPIVFMYSYGIMCGMGTSSFRAICMFALRLLAPVFGRTYDVLTALSLSGILLLLDQPLYMYNSGFLFSFGAVVGISVIRPSLAIWKGILDSATWKMKFADDEISFAKELLIKAMEGLEGGLSVLLSTLPVYASFFYTYPLHSLFLNLIVIPVMGILMILGILTMLLGAVGTLPAIIPATAVHIILSGYRLLCSSEGLIRGSTWYMGHSFKWQVVLYVIFMAAFVWLSQVLGNDTDIKRITGRYNVTPGILKLSTAFIPLAAVLVLTLHIRPGLEIDMIDVGQGDGIVISCSGNHMLIDGGSTSNKNVGKYRIIPFLKYKGIGTLDAVVITHEDEDHMSGVLEIMDDMEKGGISIKQLLMPDVGTLSRGDNYKLLISRAKELSIPVSYISAGKEFYMGKAEFICLNPEKGRVFTGANAYSTVLYMKYGEFTALFTGDVEQEGQEYLKSAIESSGKRFRDITLLKVAHHGSMYTTDREFLDMVRPKIALISCGEDNSYGHPHKELIERLEDANSTVIRTDEGGEINLRTDGTKVRIDTFR